MNTFKKIVKHMESMKINRIKKAAKDTEKIGEIGWEKVVGEKETVHICTRIQNRQKIKHVCKSGSNYNYYRKSRSKSRSHENKSNKSNSSGDRSLTSRSPMNRSNSRSKCRSCSDKSSIGEDVNQTSSEYDRNQKYKASVENLRRIAKNQTEQYLIYNSTIVR